MKVIVYNILLFLVFLSSGCTNTFAGTLFYFGFKDIILYVFIAFILAAILGVQSENKRKTFWIWFALGLVLTPLTSLVALLIKISRSV